MMNFNFKDNWVVLSWAADPRFDDLKAYLDKENWNVSYRHMDGTMRGFLTDSGLPWDEPVAFHHGTYVGTLSEVKRYVDLYQKFEGLLSCKSFTENEENLNGLA